MTALAMAFAATALLLFKERTRTVEGTWLYMFEGSEFFEGPKSTNPCKLYAKRGAWLNYRPDRVYQKYNYENRYPSSGRYRSPDGEWRVEAFSVKFVGRQKYSLMGTGHFRLWDSLFEVDRMISATPIANLDCFVADR
jgi:hypothetical protein